MAENERKGIKVIKINVEEDFKDNELIFLNHCEKIFKSINQEKVNDNFDLFYF